MIKVAFLGTPSIGAYALQSLLNSKDTEVVVVVTTEDKAVGRSHSVLQPSPVAKLAKENNLNIIKTASINKDIEKLREYDFNYIVTCAFGQFLSDDVLATPTKKPLNIHGSLLPKGRGGAPIHWAIINGENKTGISIMEMASKMDAGNYYSQYQLDIDDNETVDSLFEKMSQLILEKTAIGLIEIDNGKKSIKQDEDEVSLWLNIKKEDAKINFNKSNVQVRNQIRGLNSKPGAWTIYKGKIVKIYESDLCDRDEMKLPGTIIDIDNKNICVQTVGGSISINKVKFEGDKLKDVNDIKVFLINELFE